MAQANLSAYTIVMTQAANEATNKLNERLIAIRDGEQVTFACNVLGKTKKMSDFVDATGRTIKAGANNLFTTDGRYLPIGNLWNPRATSLSNGAKEDPATAAAQDEDKGIPQQVLDACNGINGSKNATKLDNYLHNVGLDDTMTFSDANLANPLPIVAVMRRTTTGAVGDNNANLGLREWYWLEVNIDATRRLRAAVAAAIKAADASKPADAADIAKIKAAIGDFSALDSLNAAQAAAWLAIL